MEYFASADAAIKAFEKKFKDKTGNDWKNRASFEPRSGKYTLIEMDAGAEEETSTVSSTATVSADTVK